MKKTMIVLVMLLSMGILLAAGCVGEQNISGTTSDAEGMVVAVSILPQAELVEKVAGDNVKVVVMVPPGSSPHSYEPTPSQLKDMSNAKIYAMVGSGITIEDTLMSKIADLNPDMMVIDCSKGITLLEMDAHAHGDEEDEHAHEAEDEGHVHEAEDEEHAHEAEEHDPEEGGMDPHIWTSPDNVAVMVENIYTGLVAIDPDNGATYLENKNAYLAELEVLDAEIKATLSGKEGSSFMVYHPAWGYFANHYGLVQVPVEIEGKEPSVMGMKAIIDEAKEKGIKIIFVQSGFSTVSASAIAKEIGGEVVEVDPLAKDYIDNLAKVAEAFEKGLA
ncbi:metal ABC transporter solute-binding protein, Zn/Mn family [Methanolobus psychrotolerans]|uniref:metal ABC transporter solute-binding protein, Zn/Mn family n=1 Tax=Methanolobus psychrotolerans TaxID=1874706 RepID=UPI000B91CDE3|nr:zinc ABC transporter substrate-binding protein [Methanolobus psychrotolerans]